MRPLAVIAIVIAAIVSLITCAAAATWYARTGELIPLRWLANVIAAVIAILVIVPAAFIAPFVRTPNP